MTVNVIILGRTLMESIGSKKVKISVRCSSQPWSLVVTTEAGEEVRVGGEGEGESYYGGNTYYSNNVYRGYGGGESRGLFGGYAPAHDTGARRAAEAGPAMAEGRRDQ